MHAVPERQVGPLGRLIKTQAVGNRLLGCRLGIGKSQKLLGNHQPGFRSRAGVSGREQHQSHRDDGLCLAGEAYGLVTIGPEFDHSKP